MTSDMISPVGQGPDLVLQHLLVDSKMSVGVKVVVFAEMKDKLDDSSLFLHHTSSSRHWRGSWPSPCRGARRRPPWLTRERWTSLFELIGIGRFRNTKALLLLLLQNRTSHIDLTRTGSEAVRLSKTDYFRKIVIMQYSGVAACLVKIKSISLCCVDCAQSSCCRHAVLFKLTLARGLRIEQRRRKKTRE